MVSLFKFLLNITDLDETLEKKIREVTEKRPEVYKPRSGKANASKMYYNDVQLKMIRERAGKYMRRFGYVMGKNGENTEGAVSSDEEDEKRDKRDKKNHRLQGKQAAPSAGGASDSDVDIDAI